MIAPISELPMGVKHVISLLRGECEHLQNPTWYLHGVVSIHNQQLAAAIEEGREDDAKTAATYLMAASTLLLTMV